MACGTIPVNKNSKTILQLLNAKNAGVDIKETALPVQLGTNNYHIFVKEILELVTKEMLGLDKVDNTSDIDKPISTLVQQALSRKAALDHDHGIGEISGLEERLAQFFLKNEQIPIENLSAVTQALAFYAAKEHTHAMGDVNGLSQALEQKAAVDHNHTLSGLQGFEDFIGWLTIELDKRITIEQANVLVEEKLAELVIDLGENIVREIPGVW